MADRTPSTNNSAYEMGRGIGETLRGPQLETNEKFLEFLDETEWFNSRFGKERLPETSYYALMTPEERKDHKYIIDISNAANWKNSPPQGSPPNLDTQSKCPEFNSMKGPETKRLYKIPGVRQSLELYVQYYEADKKFGTRTDPVSGEDFEYSLRTANSFEELNICRNAIKDEISVNTFIQYRNNVRELNEQELNLKCREAEQVALSILYTGNYFESKDSEWNNMGRLRPIACFNDLVVVPHKFAMKPADMTVLTLSKDNKELLPQGKLGEWGYAQAIESNNGIKPNIKEVKFMANENDPKTKNDYWRVYGLGLNDENEKTHGIIIPECFPRQLVGSILEETKVGDTGRDLLSYLQAGEEIPWDAVKSNMWSDYQLKLANAQGLIELLKGDNPIQWGANEKSTKWARDVEKLLSKFGLRKNESIQRWILYASAGINLKSRYPKIAVASTKLAIFYALGTNGANYLPTNNLLFSWDQ